MKIGLLNLCLILFTCPVFAQLVALNSTEIQKLKERIKSDPEIKARYQSFEKSTASYLKEIPNPIDTIRTEGLLQGDPMKAKTRLALQDMFKMFALALEYRLKDQKLYLDKSAAFLKAWASKNQPNGNPIDDTNLDHAIEAYDLIKAHLSPSDQALIADWLSRTASAEINSPRMRGNRGTAVNNWNAHRLKIVGAIAYTLQNQKFISWTIENFKKHIAINLNADGTSLDFKERDAMHYHIYDLEPMLKLAILIKRAGGENFYTYESPKGSSIKKSVEWLIPYVKGEKRHEEYVNTTVKFDRERAKNKEPGFAPGSMFKPALALPVWKQSILFDPEQATLIFSINKGRKDWAMILNELKRE